MNRHTRQFYEQILINKRKELAAKAKARPMVASISSEDSVGDVGDICVQSLLRDQLLSLCERERNTLEMVEQALQKIQANLYGLCEECYKPID